MRPAVTFGSAPGNESSVNGRRSCSSALRSSAITAATAFAANPSRSMRARVASSSNGSCNRTW